MRRVYVEFIRDADVTCKFLPSVYHALKMRYVIITQTINPISTSDKNPKSTPHHTPYIHSSPHS